MKPRHSLVSGGPGSLPWLVRHDARLTWRELTTTTKPWVAVLGGAAVVTIVHVLLWLPIRGLRGLFEGPLPAEAVFGAVILVAVTFPFLITLGMNRSVLALFERGDMDLLASSPLSSRVIFASRVLNVALFVFLASGLLLLPLGSVGVMVGLPQLLGIYPLLAAMALAAASVAMLVTLVLVRLVGARRARTLTQVLSMVGLALIFLASQLPNLASTENVAGLAARIVSLAELFRPDGPLGAGSALWFPARALYFEPLPVLAVLAGSALLFWLATVTLHRSFMSGAQESVTSHAKRPAGGRPLRFRPGAGAAVLRKEWRAILRDPYLVSQVLLQLVYMLPVAFIVFVDNPQAATALFEPVLVGMLVVIPGTLAAALARICFAGEEAADLLAASPNPPALLTRLKLLAVLLPVWVLTLAIAIGVIGFGLKAPVATVITAVGAFMSTVSAALVRSWNPLRASRADLFKRRSRGDLLLQFVEGLLPLILGLAAGALVAAAEWWWVPALAAVASFGVAHLRRLALVRVATA